ncbi:MAG TPA: hypothetical protein VE287_00880, partial [Actinopolymorphaceae bacterium]|nr:hypothetical protein [Actinopolymorphaceae bacterium]
MSDQPPAPGQSPAPRSLPEAPHLDWLRKQAKRRLDQLRTANSSAQLSDAQFELAKEYGFTSWRALKAHVDAISVEGQLVHHTRDGDVDGLAALLDQHPGQAAPPYEAVRTVVAPRRGRPRPAAG